MQKNKRIQRDYNINVRGSACKVPIILVRISGNLNFLDIFSKNIQLSNFMKIRPVEAKFFHADRQTD